MVNGWQRVWKSIFTPSNDYKGVFLHRMIWLGCISACIPVIIGGTIYYQTSMSQMYKQIRDESQVSLTLVNDRMERILERVEQESLNLSMEPIVTETFFAADVKKQYIYQKLILDSMLRKKNASEAVGEIILYNVGSELILSNEYGHISYQDYKFRSDLDAAVASARQSEWVILPESGKNGFVSFIRQLPIISLDKVKGAVIFQVKENELSSNLLDSISFIPGQGVIVLDTQNKIMLHSKKKELMGSKISNDQAVQSIFASGDKSGNFFSGNPAGEQTLYTFVKSSMGRTYISTVPKKEIDSRMSWVRWITVFTVLLLLAIGVLISYVNSRRVYNPIEHLIKHGKSLSRGRIASSDHNELNYIKECLNFLSKESEQLVGYLNSLEPGLRERFFQKLLDNEYRQLSTLNEDCHRFGIALTGSYIVIVADVEHYYRETRFMPEDKPIVSFAIANVMEELLNEYKSLNGYVVNFNQSRGIAILNDCSKMNYDQFVQETKQYAATVCEALQQYLKLKVSVGIGKVYSHAADIPVSYREALTALQYRMHRDTNPVLYIEELEVPRTKTAVYYPRAEEKAILASLSMGDFEEAQRALKNFADALSDSETYNFIYQAYHVLLSSIIESIEQRGVSILDILENNLFDQLKGRQTQLEMYDWFVDGCFPLYRRLIDQHPEDSAKMEISRVCLYIQDHIQTDISLTLCSELIGLSPSYVSRLFKKEMEMSFVEYVMICKMEEAKRLLLNTEKNVNDIALSIGYSERNLNRIFQRYLKQSPGQFRTNNR
ncbi:AraC family transcriptional regulator [Paenibacillus sp. WQ 127069]|uniref:AraC family transcriptional regulator n=1 Tax=Paenibacillus baimaensis TaxID=2982185 RepID=A0ABT2UPH4_9BACL|nr:helix-turn-helix domain-containing protein [Paenibacillus sp. WQ 127069]MCU6796544.1 AraC family transcriptional regulator [Paenibacillus sp. WQ 127069]